MTTTENEIQTDILDVGDLSLEDLCNEDTPVFNQVVREFLDRNELPEEIVAGFQSAI